MVWIVIFMVMLLESLVRGNVVHLLPETFDARPFGPARENRNERISSVAAAMRGSSTSFIPETGSPIRVGLLRLRHHKDARGAAWFHDFGNPDKYYQVYFWPNK